VAKVGGGEGSSK